MDIAAFLIDAGADIHTRGFGQTVLHFAAAQRSKMEKMAQFLSEHGGRA